MARAFTRAEDIVYVGVGLLLAISALALLITTAVGFAQSVLSGALSVRVVALLDPDDLRPAERLERLRRRRGGPTRLDVERAARVVDLSL